MYGIYMMNSPEIEIQEASLLCDGNEIEIRLKPEPSDAAREVVPPPPKRARVDSGACGSWFDILLQAETEHILRFLSAKPKKADWAAHVPGKTADSLVHTSVSLSRVASSSFGLWFDTLPANAIRHILLFFGQYRKQFISQVPGNTALSLLKTRGSLSRVSRMAFSSIMYTECSAPRLPDYGSSRVTADTATQLES